MSNEVILNLSFDNQTVTDLTGNWTLDGTPNATYEQIDGRDGYSIVTGSLGRCIVLNAVDQNAVYNEYTVDFDMFVKSTYTSNYYIYNVCYLWSLVNPGNEYSGKIGNVLDICLEIGGSERVGTTDYSPIGRWVHVTLTSGLIEVADQYCTTVYVDGVKLIDRTDICGGGVNPFALSQQIIPLARDTDAKLMPNGPGICLNTFKVVEGIHAPDQNPAISLFNLSRVFNNFCTWLKRQLSTVALTGSYNDLSDKPTISTVNDGTLTIQQNGTTVDTFTANSSSDKTVNIQCVDLTSNQTVGGNKEFTGTTTAHDLIPSATDTYNFGSPSYQWNNAYIKALTINGVACGNILTHNVSEFVNVTGDQTINGSKYFTSLLSKSNTLARGTLPTTNINEDPIFIAADKNNRRTLAFFNYYNTNGDGRVVLYAYNQNTTNYDNIGLVFGFNNANSSKFMYPVITNACDLGTSTNKWKSLNGINPGALSLPGDAYIDIDTTNYAWGSNFTFTPDYDGYCFLSIAAGNYYTRSISLKTGRGEYYFSNQNNIFRFTFPVYKGKLVTILTASSGTESVLPTIRVFSCQGNV